jgi:hypothetical protein
MATYFASLYNYGASLAGYGASLMGYGAEPEPETKPQPTVPVSDEARQLALTKQYLGRQEQLKNEVLPEIASDIWSLLSSGSRPMPPLFYPTGAAAKAVEAAMADPDAYFASIPSANKFVKKLYDQADVKDLRTRTALYPPEPAGSKKPLFQSFTIPLPGNRPPTVKKLNAGLAVMESIRRVGVTNVLNPKLKPAAEIVAVIKLRNKTRYLDRLKCTQLQFDYLERRAAIIRFLGLDKAFDGTATREKLQWIFRHPLYCLLRIIERNWILMFGVWGELQAIIGVLESPQGLLGFEYVRAFGAAKMLSRKIDDLFEQEEFNWQDFELVLR